MEFNDLKENVSKLEKTMEIDEQIGVLQEINKLLLTEYVIKINDDLIIYPLRVEAYYFHKSKFEDAATHKCTGQTNRFGKLYFHEKGRGGIDICLSMGNYYLSFLIKNSNIDGALYKQIELQEFLEKNKDSLENKIVLSKEDRNNGTVFETVRVNLKYPKDENYECFKNADLDSFVQISNKYNFETGNGKEEIVRKHLKKHPEIKDVSRFCKENLGYCPKIICDERL